MLYVLFSNFRPLFHTQNIRMAPMLNYVEIRPNEKEYNKSISKIVFILRNSSMNV